MTAFDPDGPAASRGFKTGDVILEVGGKSVSAPEDVSKAVAEAREGRQKVDPGAGQVERRDAICRPSGRAGIDLGKWERDAGIRRPRRRHASLGAGSTPVPSLFGLALGIRRPRRGKVGRRGGGLCPAAPSRIWACSAQPASESAALAQVVARRHGQICRDSTTVSVREARIGRAGSPVADGAWRCAPMRLLIIEDDRDAADYLAKAFREVGPRRRSRRRR